MEDNCSKCGKEKCSCIKDKLLLNPNNFNWLPTFLSNIETPINSLYQQVFSTKTQKFFADFQLLRQETMKSIVELYSKIELPRFNIPNLNIDYERIEKSIEINSNHGWTLTSNTPIKFYFNSMDYCSSKDDLDEYFTEHYEANDKKFYKQEKKYILENIDDNWFELLNQCFNNYESDKYQITIPSLISIIEGEVASLVNTDSYGKYLKIELEKSVDTEDEKLVAMIKYSMVKFINRKLFKNHEFKKERLSIINRNWVLHGRDNPNMWGKTDSLRLINIIATIQFLKRNS